MEALTAVSVAALTIYDMCKAIDRSMTIDEIKLNKKTGGKRANGLGKVNKKLTSVEKATSTILKNIPVLPSYEEIVLNSLGKTLANL